MSVRIHGQSQLQQPRKLHPRFLEEEEGMRPLMRLSPLLLQVWKQIGVVGLCFSIPGCRWLKISDTGSGGVQDAKRDENGMEVMDLDEDEESRMSREMLMPSFCRKILSPGKVEMDRTCRHQLCQILSPREDRPYLRIVKIIKLHKSSYKFQILPETRENNILQPARFSVSSTQNSTPIPIPLSSSPPSRDGNESQPLANTSTTSKKITNTRSTSPAPSQPITSLPRLPNLVLPTFQGMW